MHSPLNWMPTCWSILTVRDTAANHRHHHHHRPPCIPRASTMRPPRVHCSSTARPPRVHRASIMRPPCVHRASPCVTMLPPCVTVRPLFIHRASTVRQSCAVPAGASAGLMRRTGLHWTQAAGAAAASPDVFAAIERAGRIREADHCYSVGYSQAGPNVRTAKSARF